MQLHILNHSVFAVFFKQRHILSWTKLLPLAASGALSVTMFGIWSVIGEVLERERVRFNSVLCLVL